MKRIISLTTGLALVLLTGCVTLSVYPYYTAKDVQFDPALLGVWADSGQTNADRETWLFEKTNDQTYRLTVTDKAEKTQFDARLFKLKGHTFLDCLPRDHNEYSTPCHLLLRVDRLQPTLELRPLSYEWLEKLIAKQPKAIRHTAIVEANAKGDDTKGFVLTADTAELQKFVLKHIQTEEAWSKAMVMEKQ
jgi:hypothetical protein